MKLDKSNQAAKGQLKGKGGPVGNRKAQTHGAYSIPTAEEEGERTKFEDELIADLAGDVSTAQRTLIRRAGFLEIRLRRCERSDSQGLRIADEHILAWVNSQRLLLTALGLKRTKSSGPSLHDYMKQEANEGRISKCAN